MSLANSTVPVTSPSSTPATTIVSTARTTTSLTPIVTSPASSASRVVTSSVIAPSAPPTTQLITSIVSVTNTNGATQQPSTVIVTQITTPTLLPTSQLSQTSSTAPATSSNASVQSASGGVSPNAGLSPAGKTAIAVVIPIVVIALLILAGLFLWRRRKQQKEAEDERRKEMEAYGFNPNQDPSLPVVSGVADSEMGEDQSGYRGWGNTSTPHRKASTTLSGGFTQASDHGYSPGSPTQATATSDHNSGDPLVGAAMGHNRHSTMDSETIGALGGAPLAGAGRGDVRRGPSNASSHYSIGDRRSNHSGGDALIPVNDYHPDGAYFTSAPYEGSYPQGGQPVIRENPARRNTRIQEANILPQQGSSGIAQNF